MESTRPIRALIRGLDALTVLNLRNGATVSEVAQEIKLPRTTTYRILETLSHAGSSIAIQRMIDTVSRSWFAGCPTDSTTKPGSRRSPRPYIYELGKEIVWPVAIASLSGTSMMVRESTDHRSPLAVERYSAGFRFPLLTSSSGRVYLAFAPTAQRDSLLEILSRSTREEDKMARNRAEVTKLLNEADSKAMRPPCGPAGLRRNQHGRADPGRRSCPRVRDHPVLGNSRATEDGGRAVPAQTA